MKKIVIVGSGVGGATLAKKLSGNGFKVTILEKGLYPNDLGTEKVIKQYDQSLRKVSKEGTIVYRAFMVGGTGVVSAGNGVRALEENLLTFGISLTEEFKEAEKDLNIKLVPQDHIGERTRKLIGAAKSLGFNIHPMSKFIDFNKCMNCGLCVYGCPYGAKWSPLTYVEDAIRNGAELLTGINVTEVTHSNGKVTSVKCVSNDGEIDIPADIVVLAAGGIGTSVILQKSGIENAKNNFFADLYVNTYGVIDGCDMKPELTMSALISDFHEKEGFLVSPYLPAALSGDMLFRSPLIDKWKVLKRNKTIGIMVKIKDDPSGTVNIDDSINKAATENDTAKLERGIQISRELLSEAGCEPTSIFSTNIECAHPGGTAAIGKIVNTDLETEIKGLFVGDASVLPESPGAPPILTIVALSKRLGKFLKESC